MRRRKLLRSMPSGALRSHAQTGFPPQRVLLSYCTSLDWVVHHQDV